VNVIKIERNNTDTVNIRKLFSNVRRISLEENDSSLIGLPGKMLMLRDTLYIADGRNLFRFTDKGRFISKFSKVGRGPGEYYCICDFDIIGNNLYVIDNQPKILAYTLNGTFLGSEELSFFPATICAYDDKNLILSSAYQSDVDKFHILNSKTLEETSSFHPINKAEMNYRHILGQYNFFRKKDNSLLFHEPYDNTVYELNSKGDREYEAFDLFGRNPSEDFMNSEYKNVRDFAMAFNSGNYCCGLNFYTETKGKILFTYKDKNGKKLCLYSRKTHESGQFGYIKLSEDKPAIPVGRLLFSSFYENQIMIGVLNEGNPILYCCNF
jgi:hypothetical protein